MSRNIINVSSILCTAELESFEKEISDEVPASFDPDMLVADLTGNPCLLNEITFDISHRTIVHKVLENDLVRDYVLSQKGDLSDELGAFTFEQLLKDAEKRFIKEAQIYYIEGLRGMFASMLLIEDETAETEEELRRMRFEELYGEDYVLPYYEPIRAGNSHLARRYN